jgi:hypothetical protein
LLADIHNPLEINMRRLAVVSGVVLTLAACQTRVEIPPPAGSPAGTAPTTKTVTVDPITALVNKLSTIAIPDLQDALADAQSHQDAVAAQCYAGLIPVIQSLQAQVAANGGAAIPAGAAAVYAFQRARDLKGDLANASSELATLRKQVNLACGALQIDIQAGVADPLGLFSGQ